MPVLNKGGSLGCKPSPLKRRRGSIPFAGIMNFIKSLIPICRRYWLVSNHDNKTIIGSTVKSELKYCCRVDNVHGVPYWAWRKTYAPLRGHDYNID